MVRAKHKVWICALAIAALIGTYAVATECVHTPAWDCSDKNPNTCEGTYLGTGAETFIESNSCPNNGAPHKLWQVFRFTNLPKGTHYVRTSFAEEDNCIGDSFGEIGRILKREANGCEETGIFQVMQSLDSTCCSATADYNMGTTWNSDICIAYDSARNYDGSAPPCSPNCFGQDKFFMDGPEFLTVLDTNYFGDSEQTNPGFIFSGGLTDTYVSDNTREVLQEGGTNHRLFHVYQIEKIPAGSSQTLKVEGNRPSNADGDDFTILFKWTTSATCPTTGPYQSCGVSINSASDSTYTCNVGSSSGRLCVAIDDSAGGSNNDKVNIDKVWVEVASPVCP